jgi:hypothetical protein
LETEADRYEDIGKTISIEEYNEVVKKHAVWMCGTILPKNDITDMEDPYITYKPKYMGTVCAPTIKTLYKGYK